MPYNYGMIRSFRSKPLAVFASTGNGAKLPVQNPKRLTRILQTLDAAKVPQDMNLPGFRYHSHQGQPKRYSVDASGNYRVTYGWEDSDAIDVDLEDPH